MRRYDPRSWHLDDVLHRFRPGRTATACGGQYAREMKGAVITTMAKPAEALGVLRTEGIRVLLTPIRATKANAFAER